MASGPDPFARVFVLENAHDNGAKECEDDTNGQKLQLPNHGILLPSRIARSLPQAARGFQDSILAAAQK